MVGRCGLCLRGRGDWHASRMRKNQVILSNACRSVYNIRDSKKVLNMIATSVFYLSPYIYSALIALVIICQLCLVLVCM